MDLPFSFNLARIRQAWLAAPLLIAAQLSACGSSDNNQPSQQTAVQAGSLFVVNADGTLASCTVGANGQPSACESTAPGAAAYGSANIAFYASHAYIANLSTGNVSVCSATGVDPQTGCTAYTGDAAMAQPLGMAFANSRGYFVNSNNTVAMCAVGSDGSLSACTTQNTGTALTNALGIAISNNRAYVTNQGSDSITVCAINSDGALSNCAASGSNLAAPAGIAISGSYAYVTNTANSSLGVCPIASDGSVQACTEVDGNGAFNLPSSITLNGNVAYVTNYGDSTLTTCAVSGASLTNCASGSADNVFFQTTGSAFLGAKS